MNSEQDNNFSSENLGHSLDACADGTELEIAKACVLLKVSDYVPVSEKKFRKHHQLFETIHSENV